jgi:DNA-binding NarL/FixJ family response regulator
MADLSLVVTGRQHAFVEALAARLATEPDVEVVTVLGDAEEIATFTPPRLVDLYVVDFDDETAPTAVTSLMRRFPECGVVGLSSDPSSAAATRALLAGCVAWLPKTSSVAELIAAMVDAAERRTHVPPNVLSEVVSQLAGATPSGRAERSPIETLTTREWEVLSLMSRGLSRRGVAAHLELSTNTVRTHVQSILRKLDVHSSLAAVTMAQAYLRDHPEASYPGALPARRLDAAPQGRPPSST